MSKGYYETCAIPKPGNKKKKILYNGYKNKAERVCFFCKTPNAERHEVFPGNNRQISIREGLRREDRPGIKHSGYISRNGGRTS